MLAVLLAVVIAVTGLVTEVGGTRVIRHVRHERCLSNIARMELELGLREPTGRELVQRDIAQREAAWQRYLAAHKTALPPPPRDDGMRKAIAAQRKESVRIAKSAMERTYR